MRFLLLAPSSFASPVSGGAQRSWLLHRALSEIGDVDTLVVHEPGVADDIDEQAMRARHGFVGVVRWNKGVERRPWRWLGRRGGPRGRQLARLTGAIMGDYAPDRTVVAALRGLSRRRHYDVVVSRYVLPWAKAGASRRVPCFVDVDDFDGDVLRLRAQRIVASPVERQLHSLDAKRADRIVATLLRERATRAWIVKAGDAGRLDGVPTNVLPNIPFQAGRDGAVAPLPFGDGPPALLFIGRLSWSPNVDGVNRFIAQVWPSVRAAVPAAVFRIVGSRLGDDLRRRWAAVPGVEVLGRVDEVAPAYAAAAASVNPCQSGGGSNIKVVESLAYGRACVTTSHGARGYESIGPDMGLHATTDDAGFVAACVRLLQDREYGRAVGLRGASEVERRFSWREFRRSVHAAVAGSRDIASGIRRSS